MSLVQATAAPTSTSTREEGARFEDDEGRSNHENGLLDAQRALEELADAAQCWKSRGCEQLPLESEWSLYKLFVRLEVGIIKEKAVSEARRCTSVVEVELDAETNALGPVAKWHCGGIPVFVFRRLVHDELFGRFPDFVKTYRMPNLEAIQEEASSVLAREQGK